MSREKAKLNQEKKSELVAKLGEKRDELKKLIGEMKAVELEISDIYNNLDYFINHAD